MKIGDVMGAFYAGHFQAWAERSYGLDYDAIDAIEDKIARLISEQGEDWAGKKSWPELRDIVEAD